MAILLSVCLSVHAFYLPLWVCDEPLSLTRVLPLGPVYNTLLVIHPNRYPLYLILVDMEFHRFLGTDSSQLLEGLHDEDERDEAGEALLCEASDVANQGTEVEDHHDEQKACCPDADPEPGRQVVPIVVTAERQGNHCRQAT